MPILACNPAMRGNELSLFIYRPSSSVPTLHAGTSYPFFQFLTYTIMKSVYIPIRVFLCCLFLAATACSKNVGLLPGPCTSLGYATGPDSTSIPDAAVLPASGQCPGCRRVDSCRVKLACQLTCACQPLQATQSTPGCKLPPASREAAVGNDPKQPVIYRHGPRRRAENTR